MKHVTSIWKVGRAAHSGAHCCSAGYGRSLGYVSDLQTGKVRGEKARSPSHRVTLLQYHTLIRVTSPIISVRLIFWLAWCFHVSLDTFSVSQVKQVKWQRKAPSDKKLHLRKQSSPGGHSPCTPSQEDFLWPQVPPAAVAVAPCVPLEARYSYDICPLAIHRTFYGESQPVYQLLGACFVGWKAISFSPLVAGA